MSETRELQASRCTTCEQVVLARDNIARITLALRRWSETPVQDSSDGAVDAEHRERAFWSRFRQDVDGAKNRIIIFSPFMEQESMRNNLLPNLESAISRGVRVKIMTRDLEKHRATIEELEQLEIEVRRVPGHQKLAVIDDHILWEGSMNILSHYAHQREHMRRINHPNRSRHGQAARFG